MMILSAILLIVHFFKAKIETAEFRRWRKDPQVHDRISSQFRQREATKSINLSYPYS